LGRLRAHGLLLELDQGDLRFTREETASYLKRQSLDAPVLLQSLQQATEGWPVALQMAVITLNAKGKSGSDWLHRFSGSTDSVAEYLAEELLDSRPAKLRDFLLRSSVLGDFCAEMCDAVLKRADSRGMIAQIVQRQSPADVDRCQTALVSLSSAVCRFFARSDAGRGPR
jgi:LuxR family maltose regulon positive regulatory protein